ncbi:hypothetical protein ACHAP5_011994 [Fusarium lateritium]
MNNFQLLSTYSVQSVSSELLNRPDKTFSVRGQAEFLAVAIALEIPILSVKNNVRASMNNLAAGEGASFAVFSSVEEFPFDNDEDLANPTPEVRRRLDEAKMSGKFHRYVTKKILTSPGATVDSQHLAAMVNEMRVLSCRTIRENNSIVSMLGIAWSESPSLGRFWPQIILEAAHKGNLAEYLSSTELDFNSRLSISFSIGSALQFLHVHRVIHSDLKPANVLIFNSPIADHARLNKLSPVLSPIVAKLCDFGYAVIVDDYNSESSFKARIGTQPWMAPEIDAEETIALDHLYKADIYSFGLLMASTMMTGQVPFGDALPNEVSISKRLHPEHENSAVAMMMRNIRVTNPMNDLQEEFILALLTGSCAPMPSDRVSLLAIQSHILLGITQKLDREKPALPLRLFREFRNTDCRYMNALNALNDTFNVGVETKQPYTDEELKELASKETGNFEIKRLLADWFEYGGYPPKSLRKFRTPWRSDDPHESTTYRRRAEEASSEAIVKVPDFAFEERLRSVLLPRVAQEEVFLDLKDTCDSPYVPEPLAQFHLSAAYFNGHVVGESSELGLEYLAKATMLRCPESVSVVLNVFDACDSQLPKEIQNELLEIVEDYGAKRIRTNRAELYHNRFQTRFDPHNCLLETWAYKWPESYLRYLRSSQRLDKLTSFLGHASIAFVQGSLFNTNRPEAGHQTFDFTKLATFKPFEEAKLDPSKHDEFKQEIARLDCASSCHVHGGYTLLQIAAVSDDHDLANILVTEFSVPIDSYGNTPGWTPMLLSCQYGNFGMMKWLIGHGADVTVQGGLRGATILHSLHQFSEREHCEEALEIALTAGLDINSPLEDGSTPLHSLFSGWDYSRGAELLLDFGGDPTRPRTNNMDDAYGFDTPLGYATQALHLDLLRSMLVASERLVSVSGLQAQRRLNMAKAQAITALISRTRFYCMSVGGKGYKGKIEGILSLLVNSEVLEAHITTLKQNPITTLKLDRIASPSMDMFFNMCVGSGSGFFTAMYLKVFVDTVVDETACNLPQTFLQAAIGRRSLEAVRAILRHGASPLTENRDGCNSLHQAARYFPEVLDELIMVLEDFPEKRRGKSITEILEQPDDVGLTVFGLLLGEGYDKERNLAESLRLKYKLRHDYKFRDPWMTFGGFMVGLATLEGLAPIEHIQYLLGLDPPLDWIASSNGKSLLSFAISGLSVCK